MKMHFKSTGLENCDVITKHTNYNFVYLIQRALLLEMKEKGHLNEMQHRQAEATLLEQQQAYIRERAESLNND